MTPTSTRKPKVLCRCAHEKRSSEEGEDDDRRRPNPIDDRSWEDDSGRDADRWHTKGRAKLVPLNSGDGVIVVDAAAVDGVAPAAAAAAVAKAALEYREDGRRCDGRIAIQEIAVALPPPS